MLKKSWPILYSKLLYKLGHRLNITNPNVPSGGAKDPGQAHGQAGEATKLCVLTLQVSFCLQFSIKILKVKNAYQKVETNN